ncbi:glycosyltransferase [Rhodococcus aerolatus]
MRTVVVTIVAGRREHLRAQRRGLARSRVPVAEHVVVSMGDPDVVDDLAETLTSGPGAVTVVDVQVPGTRLPLAEARNAGGAAALARGAELVVFLDVDCVPGPHLVERYQAAAARPGADAALLCGPVTYLPPAPDGGYPWDAVTADGGPWTRPHAARPAPAAGTVETGGRPELFWSLSFAATPATWRRTGGFCEDYTGYGGEDTDFGLAARGAGVDLWWVGGADAFHQHHPVSDPPVEHLEDILANAALFHRRWGRWPMQGWLDGFAARGLARHDAEEDVWVKVS